MRVLIVDDSPTAVAMLGGVLEGAGYEVLIARDGREALDRLHEGSVRLVVSDWEMPRMNGLDLCRTVRAENLPGYTYIILLTGHDAPQERVEGLTAGADDFIAKPFATPELLARVRTGERVLSHDTRDGAIFAMAKLLESRDPEAGAHLERVRTYSRLLAQHLASRPDLAGQVDADFIRLVYLTSPLHDIGKVGIPDSVLRKPGPLSRSEVKLMRTHAELGAQTLDAALRLSPGAQFLEMARDIAATHHERFDGSGYPAGLVGDAIPLCGRVVALADVYDALTSKRVYKQALGHEESRQMILRESAKHFDPAVIQAFEACQERFIEVHQRLGDEPGPAWCPRPATTCA